jgi:RHS repeat-associated protein
MKFTGHQRDNLGGGTTDDLDYMHARYGSPMTGRFLSVDPVLGDPSDPQSWNRYAYVVGNPMRYTDPLGLAVNCVANQGGQDGRPRCINNEPEVVIGEALDDPLHPDGYKAENQRFGLQPEIDIANHFYQSNFDRYAVEGRYGLAYLNFFVNTVFVPEDNTDLALAVVPIPVGKIAKIARLANKTRSLTGRPANTALRKLATLAGLEIRAGGGHLNVVTKAGEVVNQIPHSPSSGMTKELVRFFEDYAGITR